MKRMLATVVALIHVAPLHSQTLGIPVMNSGVPTGVAVGADVGFANDQAGGGRAYGAGAAIGIGFVGLSAGVSRFTPDNDFADAVTSVGAAATLRLFGGPLIPFRVMLQAGAGRWEYDVSTIEGEPAGTATVTHVPVSVGFAATIPVPGFALKPWLAPRIDHTRTVIAGDVANTDWDFGISGGIEATMLSGVTLRAAYDRLFRDGTRPGVFSIGIGFSP